VAIDSIEVHSMDFDGDGPTIPLPERCGLLYTVPPPPEGDDDPRLERFLGRLDPFPTRFVYLSTTGVYGNRDGALVTENDEPRPETGRAGRRLAAERLLADTCGQRSELFVLRVPGIYGPGRLGLGRYERGAEVLREEDSGPGNRIHVDDLVACCVSALTGDAPPGIYNVGDGDYRSAASFGKALCRIAGLPAPREIDIDEASRSWSTMRLSFIRESRRVDVTKMRELLGVEPVYADPEDGIRASLDE
jgi:nucleoside-diphosphate-sugar epimerase